MSDTLSQTAPARISAQPVPGSTIVSAARNTDCLVPGSERSGPITARENTALPSVRPHITFSSTSYTATSRTWTSTVIPTNNVAYAQKLDSSDVTSPPTDPQRPDTACQAPAWANDTASSRALLLRCATVNAHTGALRTNTMSQSTRRAPQRRESPAGAGRGEGCAGYSGGSITKPP